MGTIIVCVVCRKRTREQQEFQTNSKTGFNWHKSLQYIRVVAVAPPSMMPSMEETFQSIDHAARSRLIDIIPVSLLLLSMVILHRFVQKTLRRGDSSCEKIRTKNCFFATETRVLHRGNCTQNYNSQELHRSGLP